MTKKKDVPPTETPGAETVNPAPETLETSSGSPVTGRLKTRQAIVRADAGLNLRAGPGLSFEVGAVLPNGAEVSVLTLAAEGPQGSFEVRVPGWEYIFTGQLVGWVDAGFLEEVDNGQP